MVQKIVNLIGLAGQSCAGKNIVADFLEEKGYVVIDADKVAHIVLQEESEILQIRGIQEILNKHIKMFV